MEADSDVSETRSSASEEEQSWISWFCSIRGNEFFCEVDEDYVQDEFNLTGLSAEVPYFDYALDTILDVDPPNADLLTEEQQETVDAAAELLYGLIHARYILSSKGLNAMYDKFQDIEFGRCPRVLCEGQPLLPVGQSDLPRKFTVTLYCPRCNDIYLPKSARHGNIDGAYFGTTFAALFMMTFPDATPAPPPAVYVPRVFGFRIQREPLLKDGAAYASAERDDAEARGGASAVRAAGFGGAAPAPPRASAGAAARVAAAAARGAGGAPGAAGRIREVATVLPREAAAARRRAGEDDFFDSSEEEEEEQGEAAAAGGGGGDVGAGASENPAPAVGGGEAEAGAAPARAAAEGAGVGDSAGAGAGAALVAAAADGDGVGAAGAAAAPAPRRGGAPRAGAAAGDVEEDDDEESRSSGGAGAAAAAAADAGDVDGVAAALAAASVAKQGPGRSPLP